MGWVRSYISFEIKIFENLRIDHLVFLESSILRLLRVVVKILAGGRVKLLFMTILGLYLSLFALNKENGNPVQWVISKVISL